MAIQLDALGETGPFEGFVEADFDAFERKKWASRVYTLERRSARQKLVAIARALLAESDEATDGLELGASDDAPSMANSRRVDAVWAYLTRPEAMRRALASKLTKTDLADTAALFDIATEHQHASLLLRLDQQELRIEVHLSARARVDRTNAANKLGYQDDREELVRLCRQLPPEARIGFETELHAPEAVDTSTAEVWRDQFPTRAEPFVVQLRYPRGDGRLVSADLLEEILPRASSLAAVLRHLAWAKNNDFAKIGVEQAVERAEKKLGKTKKGAEAAAGSLSPGTRVTILSGLFAGRAGYLAEQEGKGKVKVMVGPVSVSVPASDVKVS